MARTFSISSALPDGANLSSETTLVELVKLTGQSVVAFGGTLSGITSPTQATFSSYLVPVGKKFRVHGIAVGGDGHGVFSIDVNAGPALWTWRNSWTDRGTTEAVEFEVSAGNTIALRVVNPGIPASSSNGYEGLFWGYLLAA
jgi:hypothetical protein